MEYTASLTEFRISALDYKLEQGFSGSLKVEPDVTIAVPEKSDESPLICRYRLQVSGVGNKEFRFDVTGEGYFQISCEHQAAVREKERAAITPIFRAMEKQMLVTIRKITDDFCIKPIPLEADEHTPENQE